MLGPQLTSATTGLVYGSPCEIIVDFPPPRSRGARASGHSTRGQLPRPKSRGGQPLSSEVRHCTQRNAAPPSEGSQPATYGTCQSLTNSLCDCRSHHCLSAPNARTSARHAENPLGRSTYQRYSNGPAGGVCTLMRKESVNNFDGDWVGQLLPSQVKHRLQHGSRILCSGPPEGAISHSGTYSRLLYAALDTRDDKS